MLTPLVSRTKLLQCAEISPRENSIIVKVKNCAWPQEAGAGGGGFFPWPESVFSHRTQIHTLQIEKTFSMYQDLTFSCVFLPACTSPLHGKSTPLSVLQETLKKHLNCLYKQCMPGNCRAGGCLKGKCI